MGNGGGSGGWGFDDSPSESKEIASHKSLLLACVVLHNGQEVHE